jgi:Toastrack DUF4097
MSRRWLLIGLSLAIPIALIGAVTAISFAFRTTTADAATVSDRVSRIVVDGDGDVDLSAVAGRENVSLQWKSHYFIDSPEITWRLEGETLTVRNDCGAAGWLTNCVTDFTIEVPAGLPVTLDTSSGDVAVEGPTGRLSLHTDSGDVTARGSSASTDAASDSGNVSIASSSSEVSASSDSGDVDVTISGEPPDRVEATTDSGDVDVTVPYAAYSVETETDSGDEQVDGIVQDDRASRMIIASTDSGDVTVVGR